MLGLHSVLNIALDRTLDQTPLCEQPSARIRLCNLGFPLYLLVRLGFDDLITVFRLDLCKRLDSVLATLHISVLAFSFYSFVFGWDLVLHLFRLLLLLRFYFVVDGSFLRLLL